MVQTAPEFNGARLIVAGRPEVWLMFFGVRHHISGPMVYDALFSETAGLLTIESVDHIQRGADLNEGTCLVRAEGDAGIYMVTGFPETEIRKYYIPSFETFSYFGFDEKKVREAPRLVLAAIPPGRELRSALE